MGRKADCAKDIEPLWLAKEKVESDLDIWASGDEDNVTYDRDIAQREWEKLNTNHGNEGYKEGITEGKEVLMQQGFDRGYTEGIELGKALGRLRGRVSTYMTFYRDILHDDQNATRLQELYDELCKVDVQHVFTTEYFTGSSNHDPRQALAGWEAKVRSVLDSL